MSIEGSSSSVSRMTSNRQWHETETDVLGFDPSGNGKFKPLYQCPSCAQTYTRAANGDLITCKGCGVDFSRYAAIEIAGIMTRRTKRDGAVFDPNFDGPGEGPRKEAIERWLYRNGFNTELTLYSLQPEPAALQDDNPWPGNWDNREDSLEKQVEPKRELRPLEPL